MSAIRSALAERVLRGGQVLAVVAIAGSAWLVPAAPARADSGVPFSDPRQLGTIGFCNQAGQQITHGSIDTKPFAWRAVSTVAAKSPYDNSGRTATLYAYQPRKGLEAGLWSGMELTAAAEYTNVSHPMTAATNRDYPLKDVVQDYPPRWDGLLQIRMYLGAPDEPINSLSYPAAVLKVSGDTWRVVSGGTVDCASGKSVSIESVLLPHSSARPHHGKQKAGGVTSSTHSPAASHASAPASSVGSGTAPSQTDASATTSNSSGLGGGAVAGIVIGAVVVIGAGGLVLSRRRRATPATSSPSDPVSGTPTKGL